MGEMIDEEGAVTFVAAAPAGGRRRAAARVAAVLAALALATLFVFATDALAQNRYGKEYEVKAAFLYNFTKFIDWPQDAFDGPASPFVIGVYGDDPFGANLSDVLRNKSVKGRPFVVRHFARQQVPAGCHLLFVSASERDDIASVIEAVAGSSVLTVGEVPGFAKRGGVINLLVEDGATVRFEINVTAVQRSRLVASSRLLALATIIR